MNEVYIRVVLTEVSLQLNNKADSSLASSSVAEADTRQSDGDVVRPKTLSTMDRTDEEATRSPGNGSVLVNSALILVIRSGLPAVMKWQSYPEIVLKFEIVLKSQSFLVWLFLCITYFCSIHLN